MFFVDQNTYFKRVGLVFATITVATIAGCKSNNNDANHGNAAPPPPQVTVQEVTPQTVDTHMEYTGQIVGIRDAEVRARVTGILLKRNYVEGSVVKAGQSLFTIDPVPYQIALAKAEADLASAEARHAQAERDVARLTPLSEAKAIAQKDYDDSVAAEHITAADVQSAKTRVTEAKLNLEYTRVEAPISGVTGRIHQTEGSLISGPNILLTTVTQTNPIYAVAIVSDNDQLRLNREVQAGTLQLPKGGRFSVTVTLADGTVYPQHGLVNFSDIKLNPETGASEVRAELPNVGGVLRPGQFVRISLQGGRRVNALLVPQRAVLEGPQGKSVFIVNNQNQAIAQPVEVGEWSSDQWIINKGLKAGDKVIVDGVVRIMPGGTVAVSEVLKPGHEVDGSSKAPESGK